MWNLKQTNMFPEQLPLWPEGTILRSPKIIYKYLLKVCKEGVELDMVALHWLWISDFFCESKNMFFLFQK